MAVDQIVFFFSVCGIIVYSLQRKNQLMKKQWTYPCGVIICSLFVVAVCEMIICSWNIFGYLKNYYLQLETCGCSWNDTLQFNGFGSLWNDFLQFECLVLINSWLLECCGFL